MKTMRYFLLITSVFIGTVLSAYDYPMKPFNKQHKIIATLGESRGTRFHNGVDIMPKTIVSTDSFWLVYSLVSDTMLRQTYAPPDTINNGVYDNDSSFWYLHIYNRIANDSFATAFVDTIGRIYTSMAHCHLIERDTVKRYINPLRSSGLSPFIDTVSPNIESVSFKRQGSGVHLNKDTLSDTVDIVVRVYDPRVDTTGAGAGRGMGIYRIQYEILDTSMTPISGAINSYQFDSLPNNSSTAKYLLVYHDSTDWNDGIFYYWVTNVPFSDTANQYWNTKQHEDSAYYVNADSIEDAKFKDGYFYVKIKAWDICRPDTNPADSESIYVHVDNFNPKVKETKPKEGFNFVPTLQKELWFVFSEAMDTTSFTTTNIKIQSLKSDSFNYTITNLTYIDSIYRLHIEVDSFRFMDTVQVRFYDEVTDLAGKSVEDTSGQGNISYILTFVVGLIQLTDNTIDDIFPDVYHGNIVWTLDSTGNQQGEIMLYEFYNDTTYRISNGSGIHNVPYIYEDKVAWVGFRYPSANPVYYYNGSTTQPIASATRCRHSMEISDGGIAWRSFWGSGYPDSLWIEFYDFDSSSILTLDAYAQDLGRYFGGCDIDEDEVVWDRYLSNDREVYHYHEGSSQNFSSDTSKNDAIPDISHGQISWLKEYTLNEVWFYDGRDSREIDEITAHAPRLHNGAIAWINGVSFPAWWDLNYFDGRDSTTLMTRNSGICDLFWPFGTVNIHNEQVGWTRKVYEFIDTVQHGYYNVSFYNGDTILNLTEDSLGSGDTYRVEVHDGFVVFDAWDGNDFEIYLYVGDTLFTPPALARNLRNEILDAKANDKNVKLLWNPNSEPDLAGYKVYRSDTAYQYGTTPYATVTVPDTTYTDTVPMDGNNHYVVTAYDNASNESGFSNQTTAFIDVFPPCAPYITETEKAGNDSDIVFTWNKITTDTLGNQEAMDYYIIYRNTSPGFVPGSSDSIGYVSHPDTVFTDTGVLDSLQSYYYLVKSVDSTDNKSKKSNMGYKFNKFVNENPLSTGDRNWVSLPWHNEYSRVIDLTDDLSSSGDPISKITNLKDDQTFENWIHHPILGWYGDTFNITSDDSYEMLATSDDTVILVGYNNPDGLIVLNENSDEDQTGDRNWVSIPYNAAYDRTVDITDEYSSSGEATSKITNLRDDQIFENWIYHPIIGWYGDTFNIIPGRGYEMIAVTDTTWNPTEYSNESKQFLVTRKSRKAEIEVSCGRMTKSERIPIWASDRALSIESPLLERRGHHEKRRISHTVYTDLILKDFNNLVFTAYRPKYPNNVLTEKTIGCYIVKQDTFYVISFDVGNFNTSWKDKEDVILIIEGIKQGKAYYGIVNLKLDVGVDIQEVKFSKFKAIPKPKSIAKSGTLHWTEVADDNIIGYSLYCGDERINEKIITDEEYSAQKNTNLKLVIRGGHETVYGSQVSQDELEMQTPIQYALSVFPNPFFKTTRIDYALPEQTAIEILIYDISGRRVKTLVSGQPEPGYYQVQWNGDDDKGRTVSAGVYFIKMDTNDFKSQRKVVFVH